jgi:hypothetical protein
MLNRKRVERDSVGYSSAYRKSILRIKFVVFMLMNSRMESTLKFKKTEIVFDPNNPHYT